MVGHLSRWFVVQDVGPSQLVAGAYQPWLVALSLVVAIAASSAALQLAGQARRAAPGFYRSAALGTGVVALGTGVWAMHFIGMVAFQLCAEVRYDPGITLLSGLPSLAACAVALHLLARPRITPGQLVLGGVLVGTGIGAMHYGGMLAMDMAPRLAFDPWWFAASIGVAVGLAILALWIRFGLEQGSRLSNGFVRSLAGVVMGLAIAGMHYTGMAAARFIGETDPAFAPAQDANLVLALSIAMVAVVTGAAAVTVQALLRHYQLTQQLTGSEARLRAVLDTAVDGIVSTDRDGRILSFNGAAERIFGWPASQAQQLNVTQLMMHAPASGQLDEASRALLAQIVGAERETVGRHRDGHAVPIRLAISRTEVQGEPIFLGVVTDISARITFEQELRNRETQYRTLIDNMPGVAFRNEARARARMLYVSDRIEALTGWSAGQYTEGRLRREDLVLAEDRQHVEDAMRLALAQDRPYAVEYRIRRRDGAERWISETARGVRNADGALQWVDGVMLDVTEAKLRNAEFETVATALDRALAVMELAPDGRFIRANDNYLAMVGYARTELVGQPSTVVLPPEFVAGPEYRRNLEALRRGEIVAGEFRLVGKAGRSGGREIWVQGSYNPVFDARGQLQKIMAFETDVTLRKTMERELRQATARAEQAAAARSSFLANMSHEIRTPMNAILGFTDVLLNTALAPPQRRHLETVRHSAQSLLGLLNDILDTAKLEKGAVELEVADFSMRALCDQVAASMRLSAQKKGVELVLDYPATQSEHYRGDALRIQQVLVNLIGNAIKFTPQGRVTVEVRQQAALTVIAIVDTGIGIAADRVERIFDAFAQADATITRQFGGTGLGTTIARQLTELMGGRIVVQSQVGAGSRFEVQLPLAHGQPPALAVAAPVVQLPPLSILVADDVPQNIELLELLLQAQGHAVRSARNGHEAVAELRQHKFDVVLMDMHMPEMDGLAATRALRALERDQGRVPTPVIALTASVQAADRRAALQAGMEGFATKPVVAAQLYEEIARALGMESAIATVPGALAEVSLAQAIDWQQGLSLWQTAARLRTAIASFLVAQGETPRVLHECLAQEDYLALGALAHRISGAAGNLALASLRLAAQGLERAARSHNHAAARAGVQAVIAQMHAVADALPTPSGSTVQAPLASTQSAALDTDSLRDDLDGLQRALARNELDEAALQQLSEALPPQSLQQLLDAIDNFDFQRAIACVDALRSSLHDLTLHET